VKALRVIIAGSRGIDNQQAVNTAMAMFTDEYGYPTEVVSGGCHGPDKMGEHWAHAQTPSIPIHIFNPNWKLYGKAAGPIRNEQMALYADALVALWDGKSKGTANMIDHMRKLGKLILVCGM